MSSVPEPGEWYSWYGMYMEVLSVESEHAEIMVHQPGGASWAKSQPLPFPDSFVKTERP